MQHDFGGFPVEDGEDREWQTIRAQALAAAVAMLPGDGKTDLGRVTDVAWQLAHWIRHGELPERTR